MTIIISEIGVNWNANYELLEEMVVKSKKIGCNLVKFQSIDATKLQHPKKEIIMNSSVSEDNVEKINQICENAEIEWFCTPMYFEAVEFLDPYVKRFKVREYDGRDLLENKSNSIIEKILETGKEVIISSNKSPKKSKFFQNKKIKWLYCVPKYPCKLEEINFQNISEFNGYSNHCVETIAPITAVALGSDIVEIHLTSDKSGDFIDNNVSLDYNDFQETVKQIRLLDRIKR